MKTVPVEFAQFGDIYSKATENENGCWVWSGTLDDLGYARIRRGKVQRRAHRVSYELLIAEIPESLVIDHLCRNRACVNPWHMEPVPQAVNAARGNMARSKDRTHCKNGHELTEENCHESKGRRHCRTCRREATERWRGKHK